ncbi:hypothetical protein HG530_008622 [Fusarium avenaceum]|nr:hypothetical protein HG530_008622 [Fusarium avenaceum]
MAPHEGPERRRTMIPHSPTDHTNDEVTGTVSGQSDGATNVVQSAESAAPRRWPATMPLRTPPNGQQLSSQRTIVQRPEVNSALYLPVREPDDSPTVAAMRELFTSSRTGRANVHQQVSTVSVSTPEANLVSPVIAIASAVPAPNVSAPAATQHSPPAQRDEEREPTRRRPGRPRKVVRESQREPPRRRPGRPRKAVPKPQPPERRRPGRPRKVVPESQEEPPRRRPGRPRKVVPDPVSPYPEVYHDDDIDEDYVDEDEEFDQDDDPDQVSLQSDEGQETLTRRTRSPTPPPRKRSQRSSRREIALRNHDERLDDALEREKTRLKARHSFMTKEVYEAPGKPGYAGPDPAFNDHWDADDEASLIETYWQRTSLEHMTSGPDFISHPKMALVFRASLHVFKVDPLTLFTMGLNDIEFVRDASSSTTIDGHVYMKPFWSNRFCERLARIIYHPLWYGPEPWAFMLFAFKWAAICRTDDRRPLHEDDFWLLEKYDCEMWQDPTLSYPEIHAKQQRTVTLEGGVSSPQAQLLSEIAKFATGSEEYPEDEYYHVAVTDLGSVIHGLDSLRLTWGHDCEFFFQMITESHGRDLYPSGKEMPALYKNCYLSVERKKLYDFKVHGHDLVYVEEHNLRMPSRPPSKLVSAEPEIEEQELDEDTPPEARNEKAVRVANTVFAVLGDSFVVINSERLQPQNDAVERGSQTRHASRPILQPRPRLPPRPQPAVPATNPFSGKLRSLHVVEKAFAYEYGLSHPKTLSVRSDTRQGPQMDICWRVPGKHVWLARVSSKAMSNELIDRALALSPPSCSNLSVIWCGEYSSEMAIILCVHQRGDSDRVENGEGELIPYDHQKIATLGRLLGFEVKEGQGPMASSLLVAIKANLPSAISGSLLDAASKWRQWNAKSVRGCISGIIEETAARTATGSRCSEFAVTTQQTPAMPPLVRRHPPSITRRQTPWFVRGKLHAAGFMSLWIMPHLPRPVSPITSWRNLSRSQLQQGFVFIIFADNVTASMLELSAHVFEGASVQVVVEEHEDADGVKVQCLMYPEG